MYGDAWTVQFKYIYSRGVYEKSVLTRRGSWDQVQAGTRRLYEKQREWKKRWKSDGGSEGCKGQPGRKTVTAESV